MTRREWSELAAVIKDEIRTWDDIHDEVAIGAIKRVVMRLAIVLEAHHARFDPKRFLHECGVLP
jgi:hypothetical protein